MSGSPQQDCSKRSSQESSVSHVFSPPLPLPLSLSLLAIWYKKPSKTTGYSKFSRMFSPLIKKPSSNWHSLLLCLNFWFCAHFLTSKLYPGCGSSDPNSSMGVYSPGMVQVQCWMSPVTGCFVQLRFKVFFPAVLSVKRCLCSPNKKVTGLARDMEQCPEVKSIGWFSCPLYVQVGSFVEEPIVSIKPRSILVCLGKNVMTPGIPTGGRCDSRHGVFWGGRRLSSSLMYSRCFLK